MSRKNSSRNKDSEEIEALKRGNEKLRLELDALRGDFTQRFAAQAEEAEVQAESRRREVESIQSELDEALGDSRGLKSHNLDLQYHLNAWGIPTPDASIDPGVLGLDGSSMRFFAPVVGLESTSTNVPVVLRGDLSIFHLTSLLSFVETNGQVGTLTVVSDGAVAKLFIERGLLRLAAWNNRDDAFSLISLLLESELLSPEDVEQYREDGLYDLEVANRVLYEGRLDSDTIRACLREHTRVIIAQLLRGRGGMFFFQEGRPSCDASLQFTLSITDVLLRTATHIDEESRDIEQSFSEEDGLDELEGIEEFSEL